MSTYNAKRLQRITVLAALLAIVLLGSFATSANAATQHCPDHNGHPNKYNSNSNSLVLPEGVEFCVKAGPYATGKLIADGVRSLSDFVTDENIRVGRGNVPNVSYYITYNDPVVTIDPIPENPGHENEPELTPPPVIETPSNPELESELPSEKYNRDCYSGPDLGSVEFEEAEQWQEWHKENCVQQPDIRDCADAEIPVYNDEGEFVRCDPTPEPKDELKEEPELGPATVYEQDETEELEEEVLEVEDALVIPTRVDAGTGGELPATGVPAWVLTLMAFGLMFAGATVLSYSKE